jgi:peptidoglycan/LPS O-acetylase OafA/YrhL
LALARTSRIGWQSHIDGMRAIAVLAVLLYHGGISQFSGGFIGVDVFFVISGFLISKIIYEDIATHGRLRIANFYERRIRRILPVFFVVTVAAMAAGFFLFLPDDFAQLGKSAVYATGFAANIFFYLSADYFGPSADTQPLLHYWSLGVEEQFYILFPMFVLAFAKLSPRMLTPALFAVAVLSLVLAEFYVRNEPPAAFYLPLQRAWELLVGSILALPHFPRPRRRLVCEPIAAIGVGLILFSIFAYGPKTAFPGFTAMPPVIGTALILWGCESGRTFVGSALSVKPLRLIGLWSYSIYMIHWPLILFSRQIWPHAGMILNAASISLSIIFGALSYRFVETPFREPGSVFYIGRLYWSAVASFAMLASAGLFVYESGGFSERLPASVIKILAYKDYASIAWPIWRRETCFLTDSQTWADLDKNACLHPRRPSALLWGDSNAAHIYAPLSALFKKHGVELSQANSSGCAPILNSEVPSHPNCRGFNEKALAWIRANRPDIVILSAIWPLGRENLKEIDNTIDGLTSLKLSIILIGTSPHYRELVPHILAKRLLRGDENKFDEDADNGAAQNSDYWLEKRYESNPQVTYVSVKQTLCRSSKCPLAGEDWLPLHADAGHFTKEGAELAVRRMFEHRSFEKKIFVSFAAQ